MSTLEKLKKEQEKIQSTIKKLESEKEEIKASDVRTVEDVTLDIGRQKALLDEFQEEMKKKNRQLNNIERLRAIPDFIQEKYGLSNRKITSRLTYDLVLIAGILSLELKKQALIRHGVDITKLCNLYGVSESVNNDENMTRLNAVLSRQLSIINLKEVEKVESKEEGS